jgi:hypothetical protein
MRSECIKCFFTNLMVISGLVCLMPSRPNKQFERCSQVAVFRHCVSALCSLRLAVHLFAKFTFLFGILITKREGPARSSSGAADSQPLRSLSEGPQPARSQKADTFGLERGGTLVLLCHLLFVFPLQREFGLFPTFGGHSPTNSGAGF